MDTEQKAPSPRNAVWLELGKMALAAAVATVTASWTARGYIDQFDKRVSLVEKQSANTGEQIKEIHDDIRELRTWVIGGKN